MRAGAVPGVPVPPGRPCTGAMDREALPAAYPSAARPSRPVRPRAPPGVPEEGHPGGVGVPRDDLLLARRALDPVTDARRAGGRWGPATTPPSRGGGVVAGKGTE